ncbi:hypothetical protein Taro_006381 [Colocasia esculenta]|uniref:Uncharacterized protein n=1 Tax=Colocasia esculenta TaxID=4460 RepID=A0A843TX79_COLES|nr:hypothetical protein [Colocasia esculenta]
MAVEFRTGFQSHRGRSDAQGRRSGKRENDEEWKICGRVPPRRHLPLSPFLSCIAFDAAVPYVYLGGLPGAGGGLRRSFPCLPLLLLLPFSIAFPESIVLLRFIPIDLRRDKIRFGTPWSYLLIGVNLLILLLLLLLLACGERDNGEDLTEASVIVGSRRPRAPPSPTPNHDPPSCYGGTTV